MKKFLIAILMMMVFSAYAETYTVLKVYGRAQTTNGAISIGQELDSEQLVTIKGFNDYLSKPIVKEELNRVIKKYLKK